MATSVISSSQKESIFMNMSDGVILMNDRHEITYLNPAAEVIFGITKTDEETISCDRLTRNKSNKSFNRLMSSIWKKNHKSDTSLVSYDNGSEKKILNLRISRIRQGSGIMLLAEDVTSTHMLKQHEKDCALIFAGLIICICVYLSAWSLIKFTLGIHLKTSVYTMVIEGIAFLLFLEVIFFTSLTFSDIGIFVRPSKLLKSFISSLPLVAGACIVMVMINVILRFSGHPIKPYFIGGSFQGAYTYIFTAILQEFLSRGVIQTSVKALMQVKYQKFFSIFLTSLLFSLMHLPFDFPFMAAAFLLSITLGIVYEKQGNIWGCAFLHWSCGYLAMAMFF